MFALWRSCQHYASPDSTPDAQAELLDSILRESSQFPAVGQRGRFVARRIGDRWEAVGFVKAGALVTTTTAAQLRKYDRVRSGELKWSNDNYKALTAADHPHRTDNLDGGPANRGQSQPRNIGDAGLAAQTLASVEIMRVSCHGVSADSV